MTNETQVTTPLPENHGKRQNKQGEFVELTTEEALSLVPKVDLIPYTVYILCGPTMCGKSAYASDLQLLFDNVGQTHRRLSSDVYREHLLESSPLNPQVRLMEDPRHTSAMLAVSPQAFQLLYSSLKAVTSYPVNTQNVIIDTTGMDERFRKDMLNIARGNGYRVVLVTFEYKSRAEYVPVGATEEQREIISKSVAKFRQRILPSLNARDYDGRIRVKSREVFGLGTQLKKFSDKQWLERALELSTYDSAEFNGCYTSKGLGMPSDQTFAVIGDSHECTKEIKVLIDSILKRDPLTQIVHVGDYLDKGRDTENMIHFMWDRWNAGDIILEANHESYVAKRLRKEIEPNLELEAQNFTSIPVLLADSDLAAKFLDIWDASVPFAVLGDEDPTGNIPAIVTHAPCDIKYLGKTYGNALKAMRNYRIVDRTKPMVEELNWVYKQAEFIHPLHIFGHVTHKLESRNGLKFKNKVFLDTGAAYGGSLTAVIVKSGRILDTLSIQCDAREGLQDISTLAKDLGRGPVSTKPFDINDYDLEPRDVRLLNQVMSKGVKYISGTMSPAPSTQDEIEPLRAGIEWMRKAGATALTLQPKYMGSRCQMYFYEDAPERTFAVSRAGWVIKGIQGKTAEEYAAFLTSVWEEHKDLIKSHGDLVIDGELLPWKALGAGLIEEAFNPYIQLIAHELNLLDGDTGFSNLKEFGEKFNLPGKLDCGAKFSLSLARYTQDVEPSFKGFNVLSWNKDHSGSSLNNYYQRFEAVNKDEQFLLDLDPITNFRIQEDILAAELFFKKLTVENGMEGVVLKPVDGECEIPYMKVRSPEYLRLVYGYNYTEEGRHAKLCRQKNISGKLRTSIREHNLAQAMLTAPEEDKKHIVVKMIGQMKSEAELDPRL